MITFTYPGSQRRFSQLLIRVQLIAPACQPSTVSDYIRESLAENTRVAYLSDLAHFENSSSKRVTSAKERLIAACKMRSEHFPGIRWKVRVT